MPRDIAFDPDNEFLPADGGVRRYRWEGEVNQCFVCAASDRAERLYREEGRQDDVDSTGATDGMIVLVDDHAHSS